MILTDSQMFLIMFAVLTFIVLFIRFNTKKEAKQ